MYNRKRIPNYELMPSWLDDLDPAGQEYRIRQIQDDLLQIRNSDRDHGSTTWNHVSGHRLGGRDSSVSGSESNHEMACAP